MIRWLAGALAILVLVPAGALAGTRPRVLLNSGGRGPFVWKVFAWRDEGHGGAQRPCSGIRIGRKGGRRTPVSGGCGVVPREAPLLHSLAIGTGRKQLLVFSVIAARSVVRIDLNFGRRGTRSVRLDLLSRRKVLKARLDRVRYGSFALVGPICFRGFREYDRRGKVVFSSGTTACQR